MESSKKLIAVVRCNKYEGGSVRSEFLAHARARAVEDTWYKTWRDRYKDAIDLKFFYGRGGGDEVFFAPDTISLDVADDYMSLPSKVKAIFQWALDHGYDYVLKVDDDVYLWIDKLLERFHGADYEGFVSETNEGKYACGAAYWVSRAAMAFIVTAEPYRWDEDKWVGEVLRGAGIFPENDNRFRVCHCDICDEKCPLADCTSLHVWPHIERFYGLHNQA